MSTPTIGFEGATTLAKRDIALQQLCEAIRLFIGSKFLSALTLAGASEEIFGNLLVRQSRLPVVRNSAQSILALWRNVDSDEFRAVSEKDLISKWNTARNSAKHLVGPEEEAITMNVCDEAFWMIKRSLQNAALLGIHVPNEVDFENWFVVNIGLA
jgi:hypothetical protein